MFHKLAAGVATFALTACASTPAVYEFDNSRTYDAEFDQTWEAVIDFFATNNIPIQTVERDSGIVYAERMYADPYSDIFTRNADCNRGIANATSSSAAMNIFVRRAGGGRTNVSVNATYSQMIIPLMSYTPTAITCQSTGVLETSILNTIQSTISRNQAS